MLGKRGCFLWISVLANLPFGIVQSFNNTTYPSQTTTPSPTLSIQPPLPSKCGSRSSFTVCWSHSPPYIYRDRNNTIKGILREILEKVLLECDCPGNLLNFTTEVTDLKGLQNCTQSSAISFVLPFLKRDADARRFLPFVDSPGMMLVLNRNKLKSEAMAKVLTEVIPLWTTVVLIILLAAIFGIVVWFLDMRWNAEQFPQSFYPGAMEGVWWSFVTLTTVGYGDKTPKYPLARLFAVVWMFVGMLMMSLLTATMTSALTSGRVESYSDLVEKKIGVLDGSPTFEEAARKGANTEKFPNLQQLYHALDLSHIYGIMVDTYVANYVQKNYYSFNYSSHLFMAQSYGFSNKHGVVIGGAAEMFVLLPGCLKGNVEKMRTNLKLFAIIDKYVRGKSEIKEGERKEKEFLTQFNLFTQDSQAFMVGLKVLGSILGSLIMLGVIWEIYSRKRKKSMNLHQERKDMLALSAHIKPSPTEIKKMLDQLNDIENTLTKLAEFREMYQRLKVDLQSYNTNDTANGSVVPGTTNLAYRYT